MRPLSAPFPAVLTSPPATQSAFFCFFELQAPLFRIPPPEGCLWNVPRVFATRCTPVRRGKFVARPWVVTDFELSLLLTWTHHLFYAGLGADCFHSVLSFV